jgi:hypothetical protein
MHVLIDVFAHLNERWRLGTLIVAGRQPLSIANFTPVLLRLAKYPTRIKFLMDSELRSALPGLCHAATWSEMNGRMGGQKDGCRLCLSKR